MRTLLAYIGPILNLLAIIPYFVDVVRKKTRPNIVSWITWTILTGIGSASVFVSAGFVYTLLPLSSTLGTLSIVILGFKYGFAKYSRFDVICQTAAIFGLILWGIFNSPLVGLAAAIGIDMVAVLPTVLHAARSPQEETWQTFAIASFASLLTLASLSKYTVGGLAYPVYLSMANGTITGTIIFMRKKKGISLSRRTVASTIHENI